MVCVESNKTPNIKPLNCTRFLQINPYRIECNRCCWVFVRLGINDMIALCSRSLLTEECQHQYNSTSCLLLCIVRLEKCARHKPAIVRTSVKKSSVCYFYVSSFSLGFSLVLINHRLKKSPNCVTHLCAFVQKAMWAFFCRVVSTQLMRCRRKAPLTSALSSALWRVILIGQLFDVKWAVTAGRRWRIARWRHATDVGRALKVKQKIIIVHQIYIIYTVGFCHVDLNIKTTKG